MGAHAQLWSRRSAFKHEISCTYANFLTISCEIYTKIVFTYQEKRENWRGLLMGKLLPLVKDCKSSAEAGAILNQKVCKHMYVPQRCAGT
jgi:hypothetical protein